MTINTKERHGSIGFTINAVAAVLTIPVCVIRSETTAPDFSTSSGKQCERFFTVELQQLSNPLFIGSKTFNFPDETRGKESPSVCFLITNIYIIKGSHQRDELLKVYFKNDKMPQT